MKIQNIIFWFFLFTNCYSQYSFDTTGRAFAKLYGVTLEKTTIEKAQILLGKTIEYRDGDASTSSHRINYFIKKDNLYITFDSGEMNGGEIIGSFSVSFIPLKEKYTINDKVSLSKMDLFGIRLGMAKNNFFMLFPTRYVMDSSKQEYRDTEFSDRKKPDRYIEFCNEVQNLHNSSMNECIMIIPRFESDKLINLSISKTTSD